MDGGRDGWRKGEMEERRERGKGIINSLKGRDSKMWKGKFLCSPAYHDKHWHTIKIFQTHT